MIGGLCHDSMTYAVIISESQKYRAFLSTLFHLSLDLCKNLEKVKSQKESKNSQKLSGLALFALEWTQTSMQGFSLAVHWSFGTLALLPASWPLAFWIMAPGIANFISLRG